DNEIVNGCIAARGITACHQRMRRRKRTRLRAIGAASAAVRSRDRVARPGLHLGSGLLPLRRRRLPLARRPVGPSAARPRPLGAVALGARPPRVVFRRGTLAVSEELVKWLIG